MAETYHDALMRRLSMIEELGSNQTALDSGARQQMFNPGDLNGGPGVNPVSGSGGKGGGGSFQDFMNAISSKESGNNYKARNKDSGAMGKYQIMPANIQGSGGWDKEALGYNISTSQFMASPQLQDAIAQYKLKGYYDKYGAAGAAVAWYAGPSTAAKYMKNPGRYTNKQGNYPSIAEYANAILRAMGL